MKISAEFHRKIVTFSTMERDLRITFATGAAVIALAIALNLFGEHLGPRILTLAGYIPLGTIIFLVAGEMVVLMLIGLALLRVKGRPRWLFLGVLAALLVSVMAINGPWLSLGLLVPILLLCSLMRLSYRRGWDTRRNLRAAFATASVMVITLAIYAAAGQSALVISVIGTQALVAMLGLFMAATDVAEIVGLVAEVSVTNLEKIITLKPLAFIAALLAIIGNIAVASIYNGQSAPAIAQSLGAGLGVSLWIGLIYWMLVGAGKHLRAIPPHIGYRSLLLVVVIYFIAMQAGIMWRVLSDPNTYQPQELFTYPEVFSIPFIIFLGFVILFFALGRRSQHWFVLSGFGASIGMFWFLYYASRGENLTLVYDAIAMGSLVLLLIALRRRKDRFVEYSMLLCELNLCFALYGLVVLAFLSAKGGPDKLSVGQAMILLAALTWDIISSGENVTNQHSEHFPRIARACFFFAYILSVVLMVTLSTTGHLVNPATAKAVEGVFESEPLVGTGMALLGAPFLILIFALRMRQVVSPPGLSTPVHVRVRVRGEKVEHFDSIQKR